MKVEELIDAVKQRVKKYDREMEMTISAERYLNSLQNREKLKNLLNILESLDKSRESEESCDLVNKKEERDSVRTKKKPVNEKLCYIGLGSYEIDSYACSNCGCGLRYSTKYRDSFCPNCGTEIDWDSPEICRKSESSS